MSGMLVTKEEVARARSLNKYQWCQHAPGMPGRKVVDIDWIIAERKILSERHQRKLAREQRMQARAEAAEQRQTEAEKEENKAAAAALSKLRASEGPKSRYIMRRICHWTNTPIELVKGSGRSKDVVLVRQAICYWCMRLTDRTLEQVGNVVNRSHTTVLASASVYPFKRKKSGRTLREVCTMARHSKAADTE